MIRHDALLLALAALLGGVVADAAAPPAAWAQDSGERPKRKDKDDEEPTAEEKELKAIGKDFEDKDVDGLIARIPEDTGGGKEGKVRLRLGKDDGIFTRTQAKKIIEDWLESRTITKVKLKSTKDLVGTFVLKWRRHKKDDEVEATLLVRIARGDGDTFVLKELEVQRQ